MREDVLYHRLLRVGSLSALGAFSRTVYGGTLKKEEKRSRNCFVVTQYKKEMVKGFS